MGLRMSYSTGWVKKDPGHGAPTMPQLVVARTTTPIAQSAFPGLINDAFTAENAPLRGMQRMMLAVLASIETARGRSVINNNIGNLSAGPNYQGAVWRPPWFDPAEAAASPRLQALHVAMQEGRAPSAFRSYPTREEGARDFARQLLHSFPEVMAAALVPNADAFREALAQKYSHDYSNPKATASLAQLMKEFGIATSIVPSGTGGAGGLVLLALVWLGWKYFRG